MAPSADHDPVPDHHAGGSAPQQGTGSSDQEDGSVYIQGIDEPLQPGEKLLWEGRPSLVPLALRALHLRVFLFYWGLVGVGWIGHGLATGRAGTDLMADLTWLLVVGALGSAMVFGLAWAVQRSTTYALTNRRVVMRIGVALPAVLNLPLEKVEAAGYQAHRDGTGEVSFQLPKAEQVGVFFLWPHHRPWRWGSPEPAFRALPDVKEVAELVRKAAAAALPEASLGEAAQESSRKESLDQRRREPRAPGRGAGRLPATEVGS